MKKILKKCCESCRSHITPTRCCQALHIIGFPLSSLTRFKAVRPIKVKADNIRLGYGATFILVAHAGRDGGVCCESYRSHVAPTRRCQAPYIVGLPLPSLTLFKAVRPIEIKTDNIRPGYGATLILVKTYFP